MRYRLATAADIDILMRFHERLDRHVLACDPRLWAGPADPDYYRKQVADADTALFIADDDDDAVGYIVGRVRERPAPPRVTGTIHHVYVEPAHRRAEIGRRLARTLLEFFDSRAVEDITLMYADRNREAEAFWRRLGFETVMHTANAAPGVVRRALGLGPDGP
jgi:ribosomal protein S18 acetylase RimI-like enzyme